MLNTIGLWAIPSAVAPTPNDPVATWIRWLTAAAMGIVLGYAACMIDAVAWFWGDALSWSVAQVLLSGGTCILFAKVVPRGSGFLAAMATRLLTILPLALVMAFIAATEQDQHISVLIGIGIAFLIVDLRSFLSADRYPRVGLMKTLLVGVIAAVATTIVDESTRQCVFAALSAIVPAMVIQIIAPLNAATDEQKNSSPNILSGRP